MKTIFDLDTPALLVEHEVLLRNIAAMSRQVTAHGKALRPHVKTHKTPEIAHLQRAAGATGLTVAKTSEGEVFADAGFTDLFIANEIVGEAKIHRLLSLMERAEVRVGVDSLAVAEALGGQADRRGVRVSVMVEVNTGHGRAGVRSPDEAHDLARFVASHPGLELRGVFTHEGHLYGQADVESRRSVAQKVAQQMRDLSAAFRKSGLPSECVSTGSTPGAPLMAPEPDLTELRPGNYVFYDRMQVSIGANPADCALTVLATVIGVHSDGRAILDAGMKSLAGDCPFADRTWGEIVEWPGAKFISASEEHGIVLLADDMPRPRVGDKVRILPNHACTCVNMHEEMVVCHGQEVLETWRIAARGKIR